MGSGIDFKCRTCGHEWSYQTEDDLDSLDETKQTCQKCGEDHAIDIIHYLWD